MSLVGYPLRPRPRRGVLRKVTKVALFNDYISSIFRPVHLQDTSLYLTPFTKSRRIILLHPSVASFRSPFSNCITFCTPRTTSKSSFSPLAHLLLFHFLTHFLSIGELFIRSPTSHSCGHFRSGTSCAYVQRRSFRDSYAIVPPTLSSLLYFFNCGLILCILSPLATLNHPASYPYPPLYRSPFPRECSVHYLD